MVEQSFGAAAKTSVDTIRADYLPVILLAYKERGSVAIRNIIQGGMPSGYCQDGRVV